jgi:LAS superfamily LD-carboxypeptidase LdcB
MYIFERSNMLLFTIILMAFSLHAGTAQKKEPAFSVVNKTVSLGTYVPKDLVTFQGIQVSRCIVADLKKLLNKAKKAGLTLKVVSGYRSYQKQITTFNSWVTKELKRHPTWTREQAEAEANTYSAKPGHSEHQLGTTVDILSSENDYQFSADPQLKYIAWLEENCQSCNFKISYPKDQTQYVYEPWHLRWYPSKETQT